MNEIKDFIDKEIERCGREIKIEKDRLSKFIGRAQKGTLHKYMNFWNEVPGYFTYADRAIFTQKAS